MPIPAFEVQDEIYVINVTEFETDLLAIQYTQDHKMIAVGDSCGSLFTVHLNTHEILGSYKAEKLENETDSITCIREHPASSSKSVLMMATCASGHIRCWDTSTGEPKFVLKEPRQSLGLAVSPDRSTFITTGDDGVLWVYDIATNKPVIQLEPSAGRNTVDGHNTRAFAAAFHPNNPKEAISGGWDDSIHFWDVRKPHSLRRISPAHICGSDALDFTSDGKELYAAKVVSDSIVCAGGSDPSLFKAVNYIHMSNIGAIKNMEGAVASIDKGPVGQKFNPKLKLNQGKDRPIKSPYPRVAFCAGHHLFEIEVY